MERGATAHEVVDALLGLLETHGQGGWVNGAAVDGGVPGDFRALHLASTKFPPRLQRS